MSTMFNDTDEELELPQRRSGTSNDRAAVEMGAPGADREVTLNTGTVLALFFALALLCAVFFGLGYSMGRKSNVASTTAVPDSSESATTASESSTNSDKPSPGSPAIQPVPGYLSPSEANRANASRGAAIAASPSTVVVPTTPVARTQPPAIATHGESAPTEDRSTAERPAPVVRTVPAPVAPTASSPVTAATAAEPGATFVQIAAVSHQEDADVLLSALRRRGYKVITRSDGNDKLIHVQIGPFSTRKDAETTRQKLLGDGYNAFLK